MVEKDYYTFGDLIQMGVSRGTLLYRFYVNPEQFGVRETPQGKIISRNTLERRWLHLLPENKGKMRNRKNII